ncbi:MAG: glycosyltransferase family 2 protein [Firmicutes bacterium]|nr:glycosyltransferase family 2 protein [Alicyclobacillaceae bacterium]MCL6497064.1 glycosyltransferase family 2 protein [Bacillota bacterium]
MVLETVGVVIPVYRGKAFLGRALEGALGQTGVAVAVVVVEDGTPPPDDAAGLVAQYPVHYVALPENRGVAYARHYGASELSQTVTALAFLDQDDWWEPGFLAAAVRTLRAAPDVGFVVSEARVEEAGGGRLLYAPRRPTLRLGDLAVANQIATPSQVVIRAAAYRSLPVLPSLQHPGSDDWLLWLLLLTAGWRAAYLPDPWVHYRDHPAGVHHQVAKLQASEREVVAEWFPRLGLGPHWARRHWAREGVDRLRAAWDHDGLAGALGVFGAELRRDPRAFLWAIGFRLRHRLHGEV